MVSLVNIAQRFIAPHNTSEYIMIPDSNRFNHKLKSFISAGIENLQIISDFDYTITRVRVNNYPGKTSITIAQNIDSSMCRNKQVEELLDYYNPIESSLAISTEQKIEYMKE